MSTTLPLASQVAKAVFFRQKTMDARYDDGSVEKLSELEVRLRAEVTSARQNFENAKRRAEELMETSRALGPQNADGLTAMEQAAKIQGEATARLQEALRRFSAIVLNRRRQIGLWVGRILPRVVVGRLLPVNH